MSDVLKIRRRTEGFWFYRQTVLQLLVPVAQAERRDLAERVLMHLVPYIPALANIPGEKGVLHCMRGKKSLGNATEELALLQGYLVLPAFNEEVSDEEDADQEGVKSDVSQSLPVSARITTSFQAYEGASILHVTSSKFHSDVDGLLDKVSMPDLVRNVTFHVRSLSLGFERYLFSNVIAKWCGIPSIELSFQFVLDSEELSLEVKVGKGISSANLQVVESTFKLLVASYGLEDELSPRVEALMAELRGE